MVARLPAKARTNTIPAAHKGSIDKKRPHPDCNGVGSIVSGRLDMGRLIQGYGGLGSI